MAGFFMGAGRLIMGAYDSLPEINAATLSGAIDIVVVEQVLQPPRTSSQHNRASSCSSNTNLWREAKGVIHRLRHLRGIKQ
jgi:hypothetical protein